MTHIFFHLVTNILRRSVNKSWILRRWSVCPTRTHLQIIIVCTPSFLIFCNEGYSRKIPVRTSCTKLFNSLFLVLSFWPLGFVCPVVRIQKDAFSSHFPSLGTCCRHVVQASRRPGRVSSFTNDTVFPHPHRLSRWLLKLTNVVKKDSPTVYTTS